MAGKPEFCRRDFLKASAAVASPPALVTLFDCEKEYLIARFSPFDVLLMSSHYITNFSHKSSNR